MKFASWPFWIAGAFGVVAVIPLYRLPGSTTYYRVRVLEPLACGHGSPRVFSAVSAS